MPIFTYKCPECSLEVDKLRRMSQRGDPLPCPDCGGGMEPALTVCAWQWGYRAASHGAFIEENRKSTAVHVPRKGSGGIGTREEIMSS
jgi:putative FmdB family regulatory protein